MPRAPREPRAECPKCHETKPQSAFFSFSRQGGRENGISYMCKDCEHDRKAAVRDAKKAAATEASTPKAKPKKAAPKATKRASSS